MSTQEIRYHIRRTEQGDYVGDVWHDHRWCRGSDGHDGWETMLGPFEDGDRAEAAVAERYPKARRAPVVVLSTD